MSRKKGSYKNFTDLAQTHLNNKLKQHNVLIPKEDADHSRMYKKLAKYKQYQNDCVAFCADVLGVTLWEKQIRVLEALDKPPHRVLCAASHAVGKSFLSACYALYTILCFPDSITITTAPTQRQVEEVLWRQIRDLNTIEADLFRGIYKPRMEINKTWYALGFTPSTGDALQGIHPKSGTMTIIFDEAVGIPGPIYEACNGLDNDDVRWLCIFNPTTTACQVYNEWQTNNWTNISISGLEHPNIIAELKGNPAPFPGAIRLNHFDSLLRKWSEPVQSEPTAEDIEWPPGSGKFLKPGTLAQSRCLGRFPTVSIDTVWSSAAIEHALNNKQEIDESEPIEFGVDVARGGDDYAVICIKRGNVCLDLQRRNGLQTHELAGEIQELAHHWGKEEGINPRSIKIKIGVTGIGWGVYDHLFANDYWVEDIDFGSKAHEDDKYPNKRCEIHFNVAEMAQMRKLDLTRIDDEIKPIIRKQALGIVYEFDAKGRRQLEAKKITKRKLKMSPDDLDAIALAFYDDSGGLTISRDD